MVEELAEDVRRVTFPFPGPLGHVHCFFLRAPDESWTLVDTGLGLPGGEERWQAVLAELDAPVRRIVITHSHPDHIGDAATVAAVTGAPVVQGEEDREMSERVWASPDLPERLADWFLGNGVPPAMREEVIEVGRTFAALVHLPHAAELVSAGDIVDGWEVLDVPGHADGHIALRRGGVLIAGDHLLSEITPAVGLYSDGRRDPLGAYLDSLAATAALPLEIAYGGHGPPVTAPAARAREIAAHHDARLEATLAALRLEPQTGWELSFALFPRELDSLQRRFAVAETLSHVEYLAHRGRAVRHEDGRTVSYTAA